MTLTDREQTRILREARFSERKAIKELNKTGKRLEWVRIKLGLSQLQVCEGTGIPTSTYCGREAGIRSDINEEYVLLAVFFNTLWKDRYGECAPFFNGEEITKITANWLMFGYHDLEKNAELIVTEYEIRVDEIEEEFRRREKELAKQLDMFKP